MHGKTSQRLCVSLSRISSTALLSKILTYYLHFVTSPPQFFSQSVDLVPPFSSGTGISLAMSSDAPYTRLEDDVESGRPARQTKEQILAKKKADEDKLCNVRLLAFTCVGFVRVGVREGTTPPPRVCVSLASGSHRQ